MWIICKSKGWSNQVINICVIYPAQPMMYMRDLNKGCMQNKNALTVWTILMTRCSLHQCICLFCNKTIFFYRSGDCLNAMLFTISTNYSQSTVWSTLQIRCPESVLCLKDRNTRWGVVPSWWVSGYCSCDCISQIYINWI